MKYYYTAVGSKGTDAGPFWARVYHYEDNKEVYDFVGTNPHPTREKAIDEASDWCDDHAGDADTELEP